MIRVLLAASMVLATLATDLQAVDLVRISAETGRPGTAGKESDWIYGDFLLSNSHLIAVVANPVPGRNANMTVRGVGASLLDLTTRWRPGDQLSAYYPAGGRYLFEDPSAISVVAGEREYSGNDIPDKITADSISWSCTSSSNVAGDGSQATVTYTLDDGAEAIAVKVSIQGADDQTDSVQAYDGVRADRTFRFDSSENLAWCEDEFFRQTYGFAIDDGTVSWGNERLRRLDYKIDSGASPATWRVFVIPGSSPTDIQTVAAQQAGSIGERTDLRLRVRRGDRGVGRAVITVKSDGPSAGNAAVEETLRSGPSGHARIRLPRGVYRIRVTAPGFTGQETRIDASEPKQDVDISMSAPARITGAVTDTEGRALPAKLTIYGRAGFADPDFGPDSAAGSIVNCVYTTSGKFNRSIDPGIYELIFSHGPEYDIVRRTIQVYDGQPTRLDVSLKRSVDTTGWISGELHSHSTPSGDNTSAQRGRVQNLVCEHIEFGPCTEHNRIDTYADDLKAMNVEREMATCNGMELTGSPLPANHQNAFPLERHPHTQDGGAPQTDANPIVQIQRLSMWDDGADKVVQINHPNIPQIYGDRDTNDVPDEGWRDMFGWTDVIEVHPPAAIFQPADEESRNRIVPWMVLLNNGYRIPGVVNTDAHYNHHGSGWYRNWIASPTDTPAEVTVESMIQSLERGNVVMSTGPYLHVTLSGTHSGRTSQAIPGDDLLADEGACELKVRVQCPNWLDVNRVQVFLNGRPEPGLNFTRTDHPELFGDGVVRFHQAMPLRLDRDTHVIVATIGEGLQLGDVYGESMGALQPVAVANPIFVDLVGDGFDPNGDNLDAPLPEPGYDVPNPRSVPRY